LKEPPQINVKVKKMEMGEINWCHTKASVGCFITLASLLDFIDFIEDVFKGIHCACQAAKLHSTYA
jgi:hypothetical protein